MWEAGGRGGWYEREMRLLVSRSTQLRPAGVLEELQARLDRDGGRSCCGRGVCLMMLAEYPVSLAGNEEPEVGNLRVTVRSVSRDSIGT